MKYKGRITATSLTVVNYGVWIIFKEHTLDEKTVLLLLGSGVLQSLISWFLGQQFDKLRSSAQRDILTGVYNRFFTESVLPRLIAKAVRTSNKFSILVIDVDRFKFINDMYGHKIGDVVVRHVADILNASIRTCDYVVRWGGDEFLVVAPDTDQSGIMEIVERIKNNMMCLGVEDGCFKPSVSIGSAVYQDDGITFDELLHIADRRMYDDKRNTMIEGQYFTHPYSHFCIQKGMHTTDS